MRWVKPDTGLAIMILVTVPGAAFDDLTTYHLLTLSPRDYHETNSLTRWFIASLGPAPGLAVSFMLIVGLLLAFLFLLQRYRWLRPVQVGLTVLGIAYWLAGLSNLSFVSNIPWLFIPYPFAYVLSVIVVLLAILVSYSRRILVRVRVSNDS